MQDDQRLKNLKKWLHNELGIICSDIVPASSDASFRRYFRIRHNGESFIIMDAPPEREDCEPFINIASAMDKLGLNVPRVLQQDLDQGYLLLSDLGNVQYLEVLNAATVDRLYSDALDALLLLQSTQEHHPLLARYDHALLIREMELVREWYLEKQLGLTLSAAQHKTLNEAFERLAQSALAQPSVWVHRDYHSRNLMLTDTHNPGVLDFQDALFGPITYDLVSLLKDCYIEWPRKQVLAWLRDYYNRLLKNKIIVDVNEALFIKWFDLMGVQRHLKATGIFARLNIRDGKSGYLQDIPRTLGYVLEVCRHYPEMNALGELLNTATPFKMTSSCITDQAKINHLDD